MTKEYTFYHVESEEMICGTREELAKKLMKSEGYRIERYTDEDGDQTLELYDSNDDLIEDAQTDRTADGDAKAREILYARFFEDMEEYERGRFLSKTGIAVMSMDYDTLLEKITAREVREWEDFEIEDENSARLWYIEARGL